MDVARCWLLTSGCRVVALAKATPEDMAGAVLWTTEGGRPWEPIDTAPWRKEEAGRREGLHHE